MSGKFGYAIANAIAIANTIAAMPAAASAKRPNIQRVIRPVHVMDGSADAGFLSRGEDVEGIDQGIGSALALANSFSSTMGNSALSVYLLVDYLNRVPRYCFLRVLSCGFGNVRHSQ